MRRIVLFPSNISMERHVKLDLISSVQQRLFEFIESKLIRKIQRQKIEPQALEDRSFDSLAERGCAQR